MSSSTSESPGKRSCGSKNPWSAKAEREDRPGQPVVGSDPKTASHCYHGQPTKSSFSALYSKWDENQAWSSQKWKTDTLMCNRSGQPVVIPQRGARPQQFVIGNDDAELELSPGSRSFLNRVNDQVRKRQKRPSMNECYRKRRKTFCDLGNVHVCNIGISSIHGKELPEHLSFHREYRRPHTETNVRHICKIGVCTR